MNMPPKGGKASGIRAGFRRLLPWGLALVLLLLIWPESMARTTGTDVDAKRYRLKTELLIDALNRNVPGRQAIAETEINAYLRELVAAQPPAHGLAARLDDAAARFSGGRATAYLAMGRGPFTFTALFYAAPQGGNLALTGAKAGHLPLPGWLGRWYAWTQRGLFRQLANEARILRNMDGMTIGDGSLELATKAGN